MKDHDLKRRMQHLRIPDPSEEAPENTVQAALSEFHRQKQTSNPKGNAPPASERRVEKQSKGGFFMNKFSVEKMILMPAGILFGMVMVFAIMMPNFGDYRQAAKRQEAKIPLGAVGEPSGAYTESDKDAGFTSKGASPQYEVRFGNRNETVSAAPDSGFRMAPNQRTDWEAQPPQDQTYGGRDRFESAAPNPVHRVSEHPVSTFSIDVDTASYAFVRRALKNGHLPPPNAVRIEELINYFDYDYALPPTRSVPFQPNVAIFPAPWNSETRLLHIGIKGFDIMPEEKQRSNLVFLVDVSGSMNEPDKLPLLKDSLSLLVNHLHPDDTVALVVYAGSAGTVLEPTPVREKHRILNALDRLQAGGSTAGGAGIQRAYSLAEANFDPEGVNRVILATDGDFNVGIRDPEALKAFIEKKRETGIFLSVLGFGRGNYNDALMQKLAQNGNGNAAYIDSLSEARKVLVDEASSTLFTIARDVKIQIEFNPARVSEYRLIGYETRRLRREDFNNDRVDAGDVGAGHSVTALYEITLAKDETAGLRYGHGASSDTEAGMNPENEYAFLKIRYKLPGENQSRLLTQPVDDGAVAPDIRNIPGDLRFSAAVAAFGMLLRREPFLGDFTYRDVFELARTAVGDDPFEYRSEFLSLVRMADRSDTSWNR
jgi:Ca-activated chloride channel homolog